VSFASDDLAKCVACGLCLAHCPTWRATGDEGLSPRGRIAAMRAVDAGAPVDESFGRLMHTCVMCRACETACPSSVPFGHLMEDARAMLAERGGTPVWLRVGYRLLAWPAVLRTITLAAAVAQRARLVPPALARRLGLPKRLPLRQAPLRPTCAERPVRDGDVWLFTGCVMDAWQREVHRAAISLIGACGSAVALPGSGAACCGALHAHAGLLDQARRLARRTISAFPGDAPVVVDSAGCGAHLRDYGRLLESDEARRFSARVVDIHGWLAERADALPPARGDSKALRVAVHDPCHLLHVQHAEGAVRAVLAPYCDLVEVADEGRCCGAGGAFFALQPALAAAIRGQKVSAITTTGAEVVASANPGCTLWLAAAGLDVRHPVEIAAQAAGLVGAAVEPRHR
jgi:glycolate oxidase iron-sulfur subunit